METNQGWGAGLLQGASDLCGRGCTTGKFLGAPQRKALHSWQSRRPHLAVREAGDAGDGVHDAVGVVLGSHAGGLSGQLQQEIGQGEQGVMRRQKGRGEGTRGKQTAGAAHRPASCYTHLVGAAQGLTGGPCHQAAQADAAVQVVLEAVVDTGLAEGRAGKQKGALLQATVCMTVQGGKCAPSVGPQVQVITLLKRNTAFLSMSCILTGQEHA